jgi:hypothetical protein
VNKGDYRRKGMNVVLNVRLVVVSLHGNTHTNLHLILSYLNLDMKP